MPAVNRVGGTWRPSIRILCAVATALAVLTVAMGTGWAKQESDFDGESGSAVRIVHGIADAGPMDVYVDGGIALIGIVFGEASGELSLAAGEHAFAVAPSGATLGDAVADGTIDLQPGGRYYATLLGTADAASVGMFAIDERALDAGRVRFRIISGVPDAGETVPAFAGGEDLSEPLQFGDASEYATIDAGIYDLELLDAASGTLLLGVPQISMTQGSVTDIMFVGQVSDATLQALVLSATVDVAQVAGLNAQVLAGTCAEPGGLVADIGIVQAGQGEPVGAAETLPMAQGFGVVPVSFATLTETSHVIAVAESGGASGATIACGAVGGTLTDNGALVIALPATESREPVGVAVLAPALEDPQATAISVFVSISG